MLFNLGLTANAAAAHENDLVGSPPQSHLPNRPSNSPSPSPLTALSTSLPGLGSLYTRYKGMAQPVTQGKALRDMTQSPVGSIVSSDGEYSTTGPDLRTSSRIDRSHSVKKPPRPKTAYQLAHPAGHACHRRLKIRPKLLLQLQQVSQTPRPLPILDVLPSSVFLPRLARKFPTIFRGKNGLGPNDLIIVTSDLYEQADGPEKENEEGGEHQEVIATICQLLSEEALSKGMAEICLNHGPAWEARPLPNGSYEFVAHTAKGPRTLRWVLRGSKNRRTSVPPGSPAQSESKRFTFSVINPNTRRHPVLASMTRNHVEVFEEYSIPATAPNSLPNSSMSMVSDESDEMRFDRNTIKLDDDLRVLIIVTSIWVAFREGWSYNFRYNDSALALNGKIASPVGTRHASPTAIKSEPDYSSADNENQQENQPRKQRVSMSSVPSDRLKALATGSLAKRSNSTGAAFIERSNRRFSGTKSRAQRPSFLLTHEVAHDNVETTARATTQPQQTPASDTTVKIVAPEAEPEKPRRRVSARQPQPETTARGSVNGSSKEHGAATGKPKRKHRISSFFDCLLRKIGIH